MKGTCNLDVKKGGSDAAFRAASKKAKIPIKKSSHKSPNKVQG